MRIWKWARWCAPCLLLCAASAAALLHLTAAPPERAVADVQHVQSPSTGQVSYRRGPDMASLYRSPDHHVRLAAPVASTSVLGVTVEPTTEPEATPSWAGFVVNVDGGATTAEAPASPPLALPDPPRTPPADRVALSAAAPAEPTQVAAPTPVPVLTPVATPTPIPTPTASAVGSAAAASASPVASHIAQGQAALNRIRFDLGAIGYTISFHPGIDSHRGLTFTTRRHIEVYVRPSMSQAELTYVIAHEMGHAVDHIRNSTADRMRWADARGMSGQAPWWPTGIGNDLGTPAGDFAECFAVWATGSNSHSAWGGCGAMLSLMAELVAQ